MCEAPSVSASQSLCCLSLFHCVLYHPSSLSLPLLLDSLQMEAGVWNSALSSQKTNSIRKVDYSIMHSKNRDLKLEGACQAF